MGLEDITPADTKHLAQDDEFQNRLVMQVEHIKKCKYCRGLAEVCRGLQKVIEGHMKDDLT